MMTYFNTKGWLFVALTFLFSALPYSFMISEQTAASDWALLLMWMPGLAGIVTRLITKEGLFSGLKWNPLKAWKLILLAAFTPFVIELLSLMLTLTMGAAELKEGFIAIEKGQVSIRGVALLFGAGSQPWYLFVPHYILSYLVGAVFYSLLFALGEEYGWRGYLQKQWVPTNRKWQGFVMIGIIWGLWHLPGILMGHNFPDYPVIGGLLLMPLTCIAFSVVFGMAFNKNHVIWVPVLFHGAVNISATISEVALAEESIVRPVNDAIWIGLWIVLATVCYLYGIRAGRVRQIADSSPAEVTSGG